MTARERLMMAAVIIIVAIQIGIPALALFDERPGRFGWQMYSTLSAPPRAEVENADGSRAAVDLGAVVADFRAEIHWAPHLAELLCRDADVVAVVVADGERTNRVPCP